MILLSPRYVPIVKGRSVTHRTTELMSKVMIASSVLVSSISFKRLMFAVISPRELF